MENQYSITGMSCGGCSNHVQQTLSKVNGVTKVEVNLQKKSARIEMDKQISLETFETALKAGGGNYGIAVL